ncbi:hypothetical protein, partial [Teichococcus deserti]|uniref:hypothetical protein n=1 Tax=Teichococcus deserti TaxID=1817963 RepID=UPI0010554D4A
MRRRDSLRLCTASLAAGLAGTGLSGTAATAHAQIMAPQPQASVAEPVVLRVAGLIRQPPQGEREFTLPQLEALGLAQLRTVTPWDR